MLPRRYRLPGEMVDRVLKKGATRRFPDFTIKQFNTRYPYPRVAVVVSKKVLAKAVERNLLRRQIFQSIRPLLERSQKGRDITTIIHRSTPKTAEEVFQCLNHLLSD